MYPTRGPVTDRNVCPTTRFKTQSIMMIVMMFIVEIAMIIIVPAAVVVVVIVVPAATGTAVTTGQGQGEHPSAQSCKAQRVQHTVVSFNKFWQNLAKTVPILLSSQHGQIRPVRALKGTPP